MNARISGDRLAREFGRTIARLHARLDGDPDDAATIEAWGQRAWSESDSGHVCVELPDARVRAALLASPVVGDAQDGQPRPLVVDLEALYLHRLWRAERTLAHGIVALDAPAALASDATIDAAIGDAFQRLDADDPQQRALRRAFGHRLTILSGGPGTGKTTTLARLLVAYARLAPDARVVFAAPTGKASARLAQSLSVQLERLDPSGELRARLPAAGMTVHRLLGARADGIAQSSAHLDHDLVLVDEASMLDIGLAAALVASMGPRTRLVLAGDRDQLASVEAGAVFADLCAAGGDAVITLRRNYRQQEASHIVALAAGVRDHGDADGAREEEASIDWPPEIGLAPADPAAIVSQALGAWREVREAIDAGAQAREVLALCDRHRVLCAMREGPLGSVALNRAIAAHVRRAARDRTAVSTMGERAIDPVSAAAHWYVGRLVIVTRNEPALGLFNGDVGVCLAQSGDLVVVFEGTPEVRLFAVRQIPACEDAWCITVHKSQGSEFDSVALVPAPHAHPLNTRELVYTGITRARSRLSIWSSPATVEEAARTRTQRRGRLATRLAGVAGAGANDAADRR